jgi:hypothetical protein
MRLQQEKCEACRGRCHTNVGQNTERRGSARSRGGSCFVIGLYSGANFFAGFHFGAAFDASGDVLFHVHVVVVRELAIDPGD